MLGRRSPFQSHWPRSQGMAVTSCFFLKCSFSFFKSTLHSLEWRIVLVRFSSSTILNGWGNLTARRCLSHTSRGVIRPCLRSFILQSVAHAGSHVGSGRNRKRRHKCIIDLESNVVYSWFNITIFSHQVQHYYCVHQIKKNKNPHLLLPFTSEATLLTKQKLFHISDKNQCNAFPLFKNAPCSSKFHHKIIK